MEEVFLMKCVQFGEKHILKQTHFRSRGSSGHTVAGLWAGRPGSIPGKS